jgi:hypothetical protein
MNIRKQGYQAMLNAEQSFVQSSISMMQQLAQSAASITSQLLSQVQNAQNVASAGTAGALTILNNQGFNTPTSPLIGGSSTTNINLNNSFPSGTNNQQMINSLLSQISGALG